MLFLSSPVLSVVIKSIRPCGVPALTRVCVRARHTQYVEKQRAHAVPYTVYYIWYALIKGYALIIQGAPINPSVWYVDSDCNIQESFVGVVNIEQTDSQTLVQTIELMLEKHSLKIENLRVQGYDGASNMSGQYTGVQSRIAAKNEKAIYVHYHAHVLNLVLVDTCSQNPITELLWDSRSSILLSGG